MIHKIEFTINIETNNLNNKDYLELQEPFLSKIINNNMEPILFKELIQLLKLDEKKYFTSSIEYDEMNYDGDFTSKTTKIEIRG